MVLSKAQSKEGLTEWFEMCDQRQNHVYCQLVLLRVPGVQIVCYSQTKNLMCCAYTYGLSQQN